MQPRGCCFLGVGSAIYKYNLFIYNGSVNHRNIRNQHIHPLKNTSREKNACGSPTNAVSLCINARGILKTEISANSNKYKAVTPKDVVHAADRKHTLMDMRTD